MVIGGNRWAVARRRQVVVVLMKPSVINVWTATATKGEDWIVPFTLWWHQIMLNVATKLVKISLRP